LSGAHQHGTADATANFQDQQQTFTQVNIGPNVWIGTNVVIMADVGANSVVGAGSVVTRPVAEGLVVAGNPAKVLRSRNPVADGVSAN
jgi:virginiamycin A acetyltransferase